MTMQQCKDHVLEPGVQADPAAQGIIGETYNRMLAGEDALRNPDSKFYLANDYQFHGEGPEADYALDSYFEETANSMFGKVSSETDCCMLMHGLRIGVS